MKKSTFATGSLMVLVLTAAAAKKAYGQYRSRVADRTGRWHAVTVNLPPDTVQADGSLPAPLASLGNAIEVQIRPASDNKGTEIAARLREDRIADGSHYHGMLSNSHALRSLRIALRQAKSLLETGEVLSPDRPSTTRPAIWSLPLRLAISRSRGEGVL